MKPKNGRFTRGPRSFSASLFLGRLTWGFILSPLRCLFFKFAFGRFIRGLPFFLYSANCSFLGGGVRFFSALNAVLFCVFVVWRARGALLVMFFVVFGRLGRLFGFAVSWLCECRLSHLVGGVNKKNTLPGGRPANREPAGACVRGAGEPQSGGQ